MVCDRCIQSIKAIADNLHIKYTNVKLGEITTTQKLSDKKLVEFENYIKSIGFELINTRTNIIIEKIKKTILKYVNELHNEKRKNVSDYIREELNYDYSYLSNLFSSVEGITIEHFLINQKIEKTKELLVYNQLSLSEIAYRLGYSSVHHLSSQFKKVTGLTPSHFKKIGASKRMAADKV